MQRKFLVVLIALVVLIPVTIVTLPVVLLPHWAYQVAYGWRYPKRWTCGDATMIDLGPGIATDRFRIDLGELPLDRPLSTSFILCQLPGHLPLSIGLLVGSKNIENDDWDVRAQIDPMTAVEIELRDSKDNVIVKHQGRLRSSWIWSGPFGNEAFVYKRGQLIADQTAKYVLHVETRTSPRNSEVRAQISIQGGGWKN